MASEDVIDLGSSDDEGEPVQKRMKPMPNAMVHIPEKLRGVTVKPCGTTSATQRLVSNPFRISTPAKINGRSANKNVAKPLVNPAALIKNLKNSQLSIQKVNQPVIKVQNVRSLNRLPPSITVKRTTSNNPNVKRIQPINLPIRVTPPKLLHPAKVSQAMKRRLNAQANNSEVLTVELDDDDPTSSNPGPQWYLRPEEPNQSNMEKNEKEETTYEKENNSEPGPKKMIEITIEDSPIKALPPKKTHEIGAVLEITIDDSPVKKTPAKATSAQTVTSPSSSEEKRPEKECHSKKKLVYPSGEKSPNMVEISIEPMDVDMPVVSNAEKNTEKNTEESLRNKEKSFVDDNIILISESPLKKPESTDPGTSNKESSKLKPMKAMESEANSNKETWDGEFHPTYQSFIDLCFKMEDSADMTKIVESKIKRYYRQVPKYFVESKGFIKLVSTKIAAIEAEPAKMFLFIKDVVDELNIQRKSQPAIVENKTDEAPADTEYLYGEHSEYEPKKQRQIRKLEKTLKKLHRAIQKLEEQEVDFDDEEDSVYIQTESEECTSSDKEIDREIEQNRNLLIKRYKERMVRVHAKFCQLTNTKMPSEPRITLEVRPGRPSGPVKRLEKWVNKKVPVGESRPFPDFHDVLQCVRDANTFDDLGWNEADIMEEARDLFTRCGKKLQRRRQENEWRMAVTRIAGEIDPVDEDAELHKKLEANKKLAAQKEFELFNKYADKQKKMNLEAVEIGDKEANESPDDSEDEPEEEAKSVEGAKKRKWKRLLSDESKNSSDSDSKKKSKHENNKEASENNPEKSKSQNDKEDSNSKETNVIDLELTAEENETKTKKDEEIKTTKETIELTEDLVEENKETIKISKDQLNSDKSGDEIILSADDDVVIKETKENDSSGDLNPQTISDESNKMKSDIDEQSLLKKIGSDCVHSSTLESTDSGDGTATSDANELKNSGSGDIISIENSSYSESEAIENKGKAVICNSNESTSNEVVETNMDIDNSDSHLKERTNLNNKDLNDCIEDILLASSDDEEKPKSSCVDSSAVHNVDTELSSDEVKSKSSPSGDDNVETVNLREDSISIGETVVGDACTDKTGSDQNYNADTSSVESVTLANDTVVNILEKDKNKIIISEVNKSENEAVPESKEENGMPKNGATITESIEVNTDDSKESTECTVNDAASEV